MVSSKANLPGATADLTTRKRDLPHWEMGGSTYFLTFRLSGTPGQISPLNTEERRLVRNAILSLDGQMWHVHILATPLVVAPGTWHRLATILQRVKGGTAYSINMRRRRSGPLWQKETHDRIMRDRQEFDEKAGYILNNAVKAGIVSDGWEYDGFWCEPTDTAAG
jgi:putative transposase